MPMCLKLNADAIFIADSHFSHKARALLDYLSDLLASPPSQLILMGDITQVLLGNLKSSVESKMELLILLDSIEKKGVEIIWLEGNHDFFLSSIKKIGLLLNTYFVPRKKQPLLAKFEGRTYLLAHGDLYLGRSYELYIQTLTKIPKLLKFIDYLSAGELYEEIEKKLELKAVRQHSFYFLDFASKRIQAYQKRHLFTFDGIIEGHFHIGKKISLSSITYIALPSFYFTHQGNKLSSLV